MKKISKFLTNHGINIINSFVLVILFVLTIFISNTINSYQTKTLIENSYPQQSISIAKYQQKNTDYKDFLIHYYETQADWINKWLAILGLLAAFGGIGIPLILSASYKEKIKEMQCEVEKNINLVSAQKEKLDETIKNIKKDYNEKMTEFRKEMKTAIEKAEMDGILIKLKTLQEEAERYGNKGKYQEKLEKNCQIIKQGEEALQKYKENKSFYSNVSYLLNTAYFYRGLDYNSKNDYKKAIKDFEKCCKYNSFKDPTVYVNLLYCYICDKQYNKGIELVKKSPQLDKIRIDGTHHAFKDNFFKMLEEAKNPEATELSDLLEKIAV